MLQATLLVINLGASFTAIIALFIASVILLTTTRDTETNKYLSPVVLSMCIVIFILLGLNFYQALVDDVYISLRYARNLADGYGLVFSTDGSKPVEGYTNFLWVLMETPLFWLNMSDDNIVTTIRIIGTFFGAGVLLVTYFLMRILGFDKRISLTPVLFLCIVPEFAFWSVGGLETPMYMFWIMLGLYMYIRERKTGKYHIWSIVIFFLLALTRPEGLFIAGGVIFFHLLQTVLSIKTNPSEARASFLKILPGILIFIVLYGGYFLWRFDMYGYLFPNTFYAKKSSSSGQIFSRYFHMSKFVAPLFSFFALACIGFFQFNKKFTQEKLLLTFMLIALFSFCFLPRVEWMPGYRYEVPFMPVLMIFFAAGLGKILFSELSQWNVRIDKRFAPVGVMLFFGALLFSSFNELRKTGNEFGKKLHRAHVPFGKWLKHHAPANASYASWDMGAIPYFSGLNSITDIHLEGLLNPNTAHEGYDITRILSNNPSFLVLPPKDYETAGEVLDFYTHPKFKENYEYLFAVAFDREYIIHVYKHKSVILTDVAMKEAKNISSQSHRECFN